MNLTENSRKNSILPKPFFTVKKTSLKAKDSEANKIKNKKIKALLKNEKRSEIFDVISKIFNTPHTILRIYLFLFVIVATSLASYMVIEIILAYFEYKVITTSRTIFETPTLFPKITICNVNMFQTEYAFNILKSVNKIVSPNLSVFDTKKMSFLNLTETITLVQNVILVGVGLINSKNFTDHQRKMLGHNLTDILLECRFNYQPCTASDFTWSFDSIYGNCFVFNSGYNSSGHKIDLKQSSVPGVLFGLRLKLYVNFYEDLSILSAYNGGLGALIRIDNSSYLKDHTFDGIRTASGFHTEMSIDRSFKFMMPSPYSTCQIDNNSPKTRNSDLYNLIANSSYEYNQKFCLNQCYQKLVIKECNCTAGVFTSLFNVDTYKTFEEYNCCFNTFTNKYITNNYIQNICLPLCPLECNITEYKVNLAKNYLLGDLFVSHINKSKILSSDFKTKPINSESVSKSIVSLDIFYDSLSYTHLEETPQIDIISLLANIGGHLGLFLGISLFSLCEIIELIIEIFLIKFKNKTHP